ncbi:MAG: LamG domain-containing protein, partial [Bacteroidota bacterium]
MYKHYIYNSAFRIPNHFISFFQKKITALFLAIAFLCIAATSSAQVGEALDFDGADDRVDLPPATYVSGSYTKEAWINTNNLSNLNNIVSGAATAFWAPSAQLSAGHGGGFTDVIDPTPLVAGTWYHVAVTYNAGTGEMNLYKNGVLVAGPTVVATYTETQQYIGAFQGSFLFSGQIDEVRIWNVAKTQTEIAASMNCELSGDEAGLLAYYSF